MFFGCLAISGKNVIINIWKSPRYFAAEFMKAEIETDQLLNWK